MPKYFIDANCFIEAKNGPYRFETWPAVWAWLEEQIVEKNISSSTEVFKEWDKGKDDLSRWARIQRQHGFFLEPDEKVQEIYGHIADYVLRKYPGKNAREFLVGADGWVIAHAKADKGTVVTREVKVGTASKKVKIPNVSENFGVEWIDFYNIFEKLGARF